MICDAGVWEKTGMGVIHMDWSAGRCRGVREKMDTDKAAGVRCIAVNPGGFICAGDVDRDSIVK